MRTRDIALLTPKEVGQLLKLGKTKVHYLLASGEIPSIKIGKNRRIRESDLIIFLDSCKEGYSIRLDLTSEEDYNYLICAIEDWKPTGIVNMTNWRPDGSDNN